MIQTTPEHLAVLNSRSFWSRDLYAITLIDGSVLRYVGAGLADNWGGQVWSGSGPKFKRGATSITRGLEVSSLDVEITAEPTHLLLGIPYMLAARNGAMDGARLDLWRGHAAMPGDPLVGAVHMFGGNIEEIAIEQTIKLTVKGDLAKLDAPIPRAVFQPGCDRTLYGPGCMVSRAAHMLLTIAAGGSSQASIKVPAEALGDIDYTAGEVRFITGANAGARRSIRAQPDGTTLTMVYPLLNSVTSGDQMQVWPGCAHDWDDCQNKFGNNKFRGQPFIPKPETIL